MCRERTGVTIPFEYFRLVVDIVLQMYTSCIRYIEILFEKKMENKNIRICLISGAGTFKGNYFLMEILDENGFKGLGLG